MTQSNFGIPDSVFNDILGAIREFREIKSAKIFGSRAKGNYKRYSDVDIAIFTDSEVNLSSSVKDRLDDLYAIYNFDVIDYDKISNTDIKEHIDRVGIEFYAASKK